MWIRCFHAHALLHASIPQSANAFCQDCNVDVHLAESVAHVPLLKRCFPAFPEQRTRDQKQDSITGFGASRAEPLQQHWSKSAR